MINIARLSNYSFNAALQLWNTGFYGYTIDMTLSLQGYLARLQRDGISPEKSLVAVVDGEPAGFLLNSFGKIASKSVAWNGGTGVSPRFRSKGVGKALVVGALKLYEDQEVDYATLEAIETNERALSLYKACGYKEVCGLLFLEHHGNLENEMFSSAATTYRVRLVSPAVVGALDFYHTFVPWQEQWQSVHINHGSALIASDHEGNDVGYALFRRQHDEEGRLSGITLHQCVVSKRHDDADGVLAAMLTQVWSPLDVACRRTTHNLDSNNELLIKILEEAGFKNFISQVFMVRDMR